MFRKLTLTAAVALGLSTGAAFAAGEAGHVENIDFSFDGPFGAYDQNQLQRGLQVYTEACASCHGLKFVAFRTLSDVGGPHLPDDQMRAYAEQFALIDWESNPQYVTINDDTGNEEQISFSPSDLFPANETQGAPDLSLMAKARAGFHGPYGTGISQLINGIGGPEYITAILAGYEEAKYEDGTHKFPGSWIAMPPPLFDGQFEFNDGHANDLHHVAEDISAFLMWTAEPKLMARKQAGLAGVIFLSVLSVLLYLTNKRIWAPHKAAAKKKD